MPGLLLWWLGQYHKCFYRSVVWGVIREYRLLYCVEQGKNYRLVQFPWSFHSKITANLMHFMVIQDFLLSNTDSTTLSFLTWLLSDFNGMHCKLASLYVLVYPRSMQIPVDLNIGCWHFKLKRCKWQYTWRTKCASLYNSTHTHTQ